MDTDPDLAGKAQAMSEAAKNASVCQCGMRQSETPSPNKNAFSAVSESALGYGANKSHFM